MFITFTLDSQTWIPSTVFLAQFVQIDLFNPGPSVAKCSWGMTQLRSPSGWSAGLVLLPNFSMGGSRCLVARGPLVPNFSQFKLETKYNRYHHRSHPRWLAILLWTLVMGNVGVKDTYGLLTLLDINFFWITQILFELSYSLIKRYSLIFVRSCQKKKTSWGQAELQFGMIYQLIVLTILY